MQTYKKISDKNAIAENKKINSKQMSKSFVNCQLFGLFYDLMQQVDHILFLCIPLK